MTSRTLRLLKKSPAALVAAFLIAFGASLGGAVAQAHVALDSPNGGEMLEAGSVFPIIWHDRVQHGPADYDLWYSTSGPSGPWIEIASNLTPPLGMVGYTHEWAIPNTQSNQVRVRVQQDNEDDEDYIAVSAGDLSIVKTTETMSVDIEAAADSTLYEDPSERANGAGSFLFTGRTEARNGELERRALVAFNIAGAVPAGSTITAVELGVTVTKTISGSQAVELRRVLESWQEGSSDAPGQEGGGTPASPGDVTWNYRVFPNTLWATAGGTFAASRSALEPMAGVGPYVFESTTEMVADVQGWLDDPSSNNGWVLIIPSPPTGSSKRFGSRENSSPSARPHLTIVYEPPVPAPPTAAFSFSPENPVVAEDVAFTDLSSGSPTAWSWTFGDGETSTEQNPTHTYAAAGTFTVSLSVSNDDGADMTSMEITIMEEGEPQLTEFVFIPAAANAAGAGTSFWITTLDVNNRGPTAAVYKLLWLPRNADNSVPTESATFTLEPGATRRFGNLLADAFGLSNVSGAVAILSDNPDIEAMSRTYNQSDNGTFGQSLPGVPTDELIQAGDRARILFLTENADFRSNLGFANGTDTTITVEWELFASDGSSLATGATELLPWSNKQLNRVLGNYAPIEAAYADVWTSSGGGAFTCYGSVLDEATSDPTTVLPR